MYSSTEDTIGDMQASVIVRSMIPGFEISKKFHMSIPEHLYINNEEVGEYLFIPEYLKNDRDTALLLSKFHIEEIGDFCILKLSSKEYPEMNIFKELVKIPSVILDYKAMESGFHKFHFTFSRNDLKSVSEFIFDSKRKIPTFEVEYLGKSRGFNWVIEKAGEVESLFAIEISITMPESKLESMGNFRNIKWKRRPRYNGPSDSMDALYRIQGRETLHNNGTFQRISLENHIFRAVTGNELWQFNSIRSLENFYPILYQTHEFDGENLKIRGIVSQNYSKTLMESISEVNSKHPGWNVSLTKAEFLGTSKTGLLLPGLKASEPGK